MHRFERMKDAVQDHAFDLTHHLGHRELPKTCRLGHIGVHKPVMNLRDYLVSSPDAVPHAVHRSHPEFPWGMLLNDRYGDCGPAMCIHANEAFHLDAATPVPPWGDGDAELFYEQAGGFDPSRPDQTDNGVDNAVMFPRWESHGIKCERDNSTHRIVGTVFVDPKDEEITKRAIWEFVVCFRAMALPVTAQGQTHWRVTDPTLQGDAAPASWGYHDIPLLSYDQHRLRNVSWGEQLLVDWEFDKAYAVQGLVVITEEMTNLSGVSPAGFDWTKLNADMATFPPAPAE